MYIYNQIVDIPFEYMRKYLLQLEDDRLKSLVESLLLIMMEDSEQDLNLILENIEVYKNFFGYMNVIHRHTRNHFKLRSFG